MKYILDDAGTPQPCHDVLAWARWMETHDVTIAFDEIPHRTHKREKIRVSTVFIGLDYGLVSVGGPRVFETMIFGGSYNGYQDHYASRDDALRGHDSAIARVRAAS